MRRSWIIALLVVVVAVTQTPAQKTFTVNMPNKDPLPNALRKQNPYVFVAAKGLKPLSEAKDGSSESGADPLDYMHVCGVAYEGDAHLLITDEVNGNIRHLGWVRKAYCVETPQALMTKPDMIYRKALLVNTIDSLKKGVDAHQPVPVSLAPFTDAPVLEPLRLFNIFFVYADTAPSRTDEGYVLLGTQASFDMKKATTVEGGDKYVRNIVLGWVPKARMCPWDTHQALEWDVPSTKAGAPARRKAPVKFYGSAQDAIDILHGKTTRADNTPIKEGFTEPDFVDGSARELLYNQMRFPILRPDPNEFDQAKLPNVRGKLYKVGCVGSYYDENGKVVADEEQIQRLRDKIARVKEQVDIVEVLFVLDGTDSMTEYIKAARDAVKRITDSVRKDGRKVRIAMSYYRDVSPEEKRKKEPDPVKLDQSVETSELVDVNDREAMKKFIEDSKYHRTEESGDACEQMFHGLKRSIEKAGFNKDKYARKIVVLIGDCGDEADNKGHEAEIVAKLIPTQTDSMGRKRLVGMPIEFVALQVCEVDQAKEHKDAKTKFRSQVETIQKLYAKTIEEVGLKDLEPARYVNQLQTEQVIASILERFKVLDKRAVETAIELDSIGRGQWLKFGPLMEQLFEAERVDPKVIKVLKTKGGQAFQVGYVWAEDEAKIRQIRLKYLVAHKDLVEITRALTNLKNKWEDKEEDKDTEKLATALVGGALGEDGKKMSFVTARTKLKGLDMRSWLLTYTTENLAYSKEVEEEMSRVLKKNELLRYIMDDKTIKFEAWDDTKTSKLGTIKRWRALPKTIEDDPRGFYLGGHSGASDDKKKDAKNEEIRFYWLDFEDEWP